MEPSKLDRPVLTPAEHEACVEELRRLREVRDRDLPGLLREARTFVASDAVEEMIQISEDQAVVGARIGRLEALLRTARVVEDDVAAHVVALGRSVQLEYLRTGHVATYRVAGVPQQFGSGTVSAASPLGAALMGRSAGDLVAVALPGGRVEDVRILSVLREQKAA
jgi:transcription elongation factor GreA